MKYDFKAQKIARIICHYLLLCCPREGINPRELMPPFTILAARLFLYSPTILEKRFTEILRLETQFLTYLEKQSFNSKAETQVEIKSLNLAIDSALKSSKNSKCT